MVPERIKIDVDGRRRRRDHQTNAVRSKANTRVEPTDRLQRRVSCDVPGRCSLKRVVHPGDFRQSESSSNEQADRKDPDERTRTTGPHKIDLLSKVPEVTLAFWIIKICAVLSR